MLRTGSMAVSLALLYAPYSQAQVSFPGRLVEISSPQSDWGEKSPIILLTITNLDSKPYSSKMPVEWYGNIQDIFVVHHRSGELPNPQAFTSHGYSFATVLAPGERVTLAFRLSAVAKLPEKVAGKENLQVRLATFGDEGDPPRALTGPPVVVTIGGKPESFLPLERIATDRDVQDAFAILKHSGYGAQDKLRVLQMAREQVLRGGKGEIFWQLVHATDSTFAIVEILSDLPVALADPKGLIHLLDSKDVAVRRAALKNMAKIGKNPDAAKFVEQFIKSQKDEPSLIQGKAALKKLRGD